MVAIGGIADIVQQWHEMARSRMRRYSHGIGKSLFAWHCVVELRGLKLRANHVVAIEPISDL